MLANNDALYVIGDIHGRLDLLERMVETVNRDIKVRGGQNIVVTLGDYIDRGPNSRGVLDCLLTNPFSAQYVALKGNHEALLESFLSNPAVGADWWRLGGLETLRSFGLTVKPRVLGPNFERLADQLRAALSAKQREFLNSLKTSLMVGGYFMCHAGVRPGVALERQSEDDLLWIRNEFLDSDADFGKVVIHGHTPVAKPQVRANRINIDTGAFSTGHLTCVVLEDDKHRFIST